MFSKQTNTLPTHVNGMYHKKKPQQTDPACGKDVCNPVDICQHKTLKLCFHCVVELLGWLKLQVLVDFDTETTTSKNAFFLDLVVTTLLISGTFRSEFPMGIDSLYRCFAAFLASDSISHFPTIAIACL